MAFRLPTGKYNHGSDDAENSGKVPPISTSRKGSLVVAAIDFGTTYSGYAYSFFSEYKSDRLKIFANESWSADGDMLSMKAPTTVLFDRSGKFHSFGYEAETKYSKLAEDDKHTGWQYFKRFKMKLFENTNIRKDMKIKDDQGKPKLAFEVFGAAIGYLKDHLMGRLQKRITNLKVTDVFWVLTVPAIWDDAAKQFMEVSANQAGIPDTLFTLALEPECAAIFCKELSVKKAEETNEAGDLQAFDPGSKFMVVDLGGGTVDITAHEVNRDGTLKELIAPSGGPWGGINVDAAFMQMIKEIFTEEVIQSFHDECKSDELDLDRMFEVKKRSISDEDEKITIKPPRSLIDFYNETHTRTNFDSCLKQGAFATFIQKKRDKLLCNSQLFIDLFKEPKEKLIAHLKKILSQRPLQAVDTLLLVGGFSESKVMQSAIIKAMKDKRVIFPNEAGLAVVKGAVMYGFNADSISSRKMPFTYGISAAVPFNDRIHPEGKKVTRYGVDKCEDIFKVFIEKGKEVVPEKTIVENTFNCPYQGAQNITVEIYRSTEVNPRFIDDPGAKKIGDLILQLSKQSNNEVQVIDVKMKFGKTQLEVMARQSGGSKGMVIATFNFLS